MDKLILLTNDDGISAPGILAIKKSLSGLGEVVVVAPDRSRSACGHGITLHKPLRAVRAAMGDGSHGYATTGLPTDCIHIGVMEICPRKPDLIVSGINLGANLGWELTYSGTVAGAMEGAAFGIPAFAISICTYEDADVFEPAAQFGRYLAEQILDKGLPDGVFLNVNVPHVPGGQINELVYTRAGIRRYPGKVESRTDPLGRTYYWLGGDVPMDGLEEGTDVLAISEGKISVTPVHLDLTAYNYLDHVSKWELQQYFHGMKVEV